jgi:hypothetical protein
MSEEVFAGMIAATRLRVDFHEQIQETRPHPVEQRRDPGQQSAPKCCPSKSK